MRDIWSSAPEWATHLARDSYDKTWFWYNDKPVYVDVSWFMDPNSDLEGWKCTKADNVTQQLLNKMLPNISSEDSLLVKEDIYFSWVDGDTGPITRPKLHELLALPTDDVMHMLYTLTAKQFMEMQLDRYNIIIDRLFSRINTNLSYNGRAVSLINYYSAAIKDTQQNLKG